MKKRAEEDHEGHEGRSWLEELLSAFTDVHAGEGVQALLLTLSIFLVLVAYYLLKVVREPMILAGGAFGLEGATLRAAAAAGSAVVLLAVVPAYAAFASRVGRMRLINVVTAIFVVCLVLFYVAAGRVPVGFPFFIWLGIFNMLVVAQFWAFANDLYTPQQGKRLFAIVAFGQTTGAIAGSVIAAKLVPLVGLYPLLLVAAALLVASTAVANLIDRRAPRPAPVAAAVPAAPEPDKKGGFRLVFKSRYLLMVGALVLVYNTVNSHGEYILGAVVLEHAKAEVAAAGDSDAETVKHDQERIIGSFYGGYFGMVNVLTALFQLFLVSRILKYGGVRLALLIMPTISLSGYAMIATIPILALIRVTKIVENATDYSLQNTTRQALFLPTTRAEKYQAKAAIDTFFVRSGDVLALAIIALVVEVLHLGVKGLAVVNVALVVVWWALAQAIGKRYDRMVPGQGTKA